MLPLSTFQLWNVKPVMLFSSVAQSCPTLCDPVDYSQASLSITISQSLLKLMSIESEMPSNHLILCRPLLLLPSVFPSIRVISNESALHIRRAKYWYIISSLLFKFNLLLMVLLCHLPSNLFQWTPIFRWWDPDILGQSGKEIYPSVTSAWKNLKANSICWAWKAPMKLTKVGAK